MAFLLLEWFVPDNEALTGDLLEESRERSATWLWRQVLFAVLGQAIVRVRTSPRMTAEGILIATALLALLGFQAVVGATLMNHLLVLSDPAWGQTGQYQAWQRYVIVPSLAVAVPDGESHQPSPSHPSRGGCARAERERHDCNIPQSPALRAERVSPTLLAAGRSADPCGDGLHRRVVRRHRLEVHMRIAALGVIYSALLIAAGLQAQIGPSFEVASIRRNLTANQQGRGLAAPQPGGRFIAIGATLRHLVNGAYGLEVIGGPGWVDTDRFDVNARAGGERPTAEMQHMLRSLLSDRFRLVVHTETREVPVYALTIARRDRDLGPKLRASDAKCAQEARDFIPGAPGFPPACGDFRLGARALTARGMTMPRLAQLLSGNVGRPVLNRTGLDSAYDLELEWSSDLGLRQAPPGSAGASELTPDGLSLFTAMQEQLGLRLQPTRGPVDVIVIDRAEPPTPD